MSSPSPYSPDRSLSMAVAILTGGGLLVAAVVYLLSTSAGALTDWRRTQLSEAQAQTHGTSTARRPPHRPAPSPTSGPSRGRKRVPPPNLDRLPVWTGSRASTPEKSTTPAQAPAPKTYDLRADMSHADLGGTSGESAAGMTGPSAGQIGERTSKTRHPTAGGGPLRTDLGSNSPDTETAWRAETSTLGRRARALSGALAQLDRSGSSADGGTRTEGTSKPESGDASTATGGPHAPGNTPDPPPNPEQVPVDGGLGWLAAAGAAYAANRLRRQQDTGKPEDEA